MMLNFAIYGCGVIAKTHAMALEQVEGAVLTACADLNRASAEAFASKWGIRCVNCWQDLVTDNEIDVVCICTPSGTHGLLAVEALNAGKHVVVEKPMAINSAQCQQIIEAAENAKGKITVISQLRTSADIIRAKKLLSSGALGKILLCQLHMCYYRPESYYDGSWRGTKEMDGGGALMNQGIHGIDILHYLMGPVKQLRSVVRTLMHDIQVEDTAVAALEFENSALGVITASTATHPGFDREIRIYGTNGALEFREDKLVRLILDGAEQSCAPYTSAGMAGSNTVMDSKGHARQIDAFVRAISGEETNYIDQYQGKLAVDLIQQIYRESI